MKRLVVLFALLFFPAFPTFAQENPVPQFLQMLRPRCIGPANMSGRITEVAVYEKEPRIQYVASASGGLWKTINNGTTWKPVFEREKTGALGAVAVCQSNPDLVWVGTGEANARNSVSWGDGVYRSSDSGKSWRNMGLARTQHIGRIVIHPKNPDIAYVAALGKLWAANKERGVFKTSDAGKTWEHVFAINDSTGCIDLAMDPDDPDLLYAAAYHVQRGLFSGGNPEVQTGPGSGLFKTRDGGKTWQKMENGLPKRPLGRCGFSIYLRNPNVIFAVVQTDKTPITVQGQAANEKLNLDAGGIFRSDDKGQTWKHLNSLVPRPFYYGQIRVDPNDVKRLYVLGISLHLSTNGGKSFINGNLAKGTHGDYHALWIDPRDSHHLVLGCDGGLNYSYDRGVTWERLKNLPVSQFYGIAVDMRKPYRVYGGIQDNGTWAGPNTTHDAAGISIAQWFNVLGYDGFYCQVHPKDDDIAYCEGQYGNLYRKNVHTGSGVSIRPRLDSEDEATNIEPRPRNAAAFRFNWSSPILQSPYSDDEIFCAGNHLFVSRNRGDTWRIASPDLTRGKPGPNGLKAHTITTIAASPLEDHVIYAGTDDGKIWICKNWKQQVWTDLSDAIPQMPASRWITRLETSHFAKGTVYLAIDRHRNDDRKPCLFRSTDHGSHWTSIAGNLPEDGPIRVIREDPVNKDLLYAGTEFGLFISLDAGKNWHKQKHLPTVPVHDLVIHPRDREMIIGTHGRGIWIMDVLPLQSLPPAAIQADAHFCPIRSAIAFRRQSKQKLGIKTFFGENAPYGAGLCFYLRDMPTQVPTVTILNSMGIKVAELKTTATAGLHQACWDLNRPGTKKGAYDPVAAGTYTAVLRVGATVHKQDFQVEVEN